MRPHGTIFFGESPAQNFLGGATPNGRRYRNLCHQSRRTVAVSRGLWGLWSEPAKSQLVHHESYPRALPLQAKKFKNQGKLKAGAEPKANYIRTAQPERLPKLLSAERVLFTFTFHFERARAHFFVPTETTDNRD